MSLRNGTLTRYLPAGVEKTEVADDDIPGVLAEVFGADPALHTEAAAVHRKYSASPHPPSAARREG